jgi:hypothetical protein
MTRVGKKAATAGADAPVKPKAKKAKGEQGAAQTKAKPQRAPADQGDTLVTPQAETRTRPQDKFGGVEDQLVAFLGLGVELLAPKGSPERIKIGDAGQRLERILRSILP